MAESNKKRATRLLNKISETEKELEQKSEDKIDNATTTNKVQVNNKQLLEENISNSVKDVVNDRFDSSRITFPSYHDENEPQRGFEFVDGADVSVLNKTENFSNDIDPLDSDTDDDISKYKDDDKFFYTCMEINDNEKTDHGRKENVNDDEISSNNENIENEDGKEEKNKKKEKKNFINQTENNNNIDNNNDDDDNEGECGKDNIPDDLNVIINYNDLVDFMCDHFICKKCGKKQTKQNFRHTSCGIATTFHFRCPHCWKQKSIGTEKTKKGVSLSNREDDAKMKKGLASYAMNLRLVLWAQSFGIGMTAVRQLVSTLGLSTHVYSFGTFGKLEEFIGLLEIELCKKIIDESIKLEMMRSPKNLSCGRYMLCITMDGGWSHRGTGKSFDSNIGFHIIIGCRTHNVIALFVMSRVCSKCDQNNKHSSDLCPKNFTGSSKAMEAFGAAQNVKWIFENYNCYVQTIIMDDDTSSKSVLRTKFAEEELQAKKEGRKFLWPRTGPKDLKARDTGRLPLGHKKVTFLADINHRLKNKSSLEFTLSRSKKKFLYAQIQMHIE